MTDSIDSLLRQAGDLPVFAEGGLRELDKRLQLVESLMARLGLLPSELHQLVLVKPPHLVLSMSGDTLDIGRDCGIEDDALSRRHFFLHLSEGEVALTDCGSHNGTWVNGDRVNSRRLCDGDLVQAGHSAFLFLRAERSED